MRNPNLTATTAEDMLKILTGNDYEQAIKLHDLGEKLNLKIEPRTGSQYYRIQYSTKKPKRSIYTIECNDKKWRIKASLQSIMQYIEKASNCTDTLKDCIKATRTCTQCNDKCVKGTAFELDNKKYYSCIGSGHFFGNMNNSDYDDLVTLLEKEVYSIQN